MLLPLDVNGNTHYGYILFVHDQLEWALVDQSPEQSETECLFVDVAVYKIIDTLKTGLRYTHTSILA